MTNKSALLFPAFITDYTRKEIDTLTSNGIDFTDYVRVASDKLGIRLPDFSYDSEEYRNDELLAQVIAYLFGCAFSDLLKNNAVKPNFGAGYSMGIYANLYAAESISLEDGILIIYRAFELVNELACNGKYGMGAIIGLGVDDINDIINKSNINAEVINTNSEFSYVISGKKADVVRTLDEAKNEGALNAIPLNVNTPYHSSYLGGFANRFAKFIEFIDIKKSQYPIISTYNQRIVDSPSEIRKELVYNLTEKINWYKTMQVLLNNGVNEFYESGAGKDLSKGARFINGEFKFIRL
ncbi:MAG: hypothetical protein A2W99_08990 [Bacteroidetes bacterium GWF2_33_16]|nr:MAG: hypothetical protein A2X00_07435 [Bacteroidetes bacterium GWE2_32_14]OFY03745.1 MAG: hypothetical protein A2W99_08990 [Bacteroidetes bacterium GWF2_33_16]